MIQSRLDVLIDRVVDLPVYTIIIVNDDTPISYPGSHDTVHVLPSLNPLHDGTPCFIRRFPQEGLLHDLLKHLETKR
jgi:hypothetical protein